MRVEDGLRFDDATIADLQQLYTTSQASCFQVVRHLLDRIARVDRSGVSLNNR